MLTKDEREILEELRDCQEMIYDANYTPKQRRILKEMQGKGLVVLVWIIQPKGKQECGESH